MLPAQLGERPARRKLRRDGQPVSVEPQRRSRASTTSCSTASAAATRPPTRPTPSAPDDHRRRGRPPTPRATRPCRWTTDEPSTSIVDYGRTTALGFEAEDTRRSPTTASSSPASSPARPTASASPRPTPPATPPRRRRRPATFTTPAGTLVDSRTSEFAAGTPQRHLRRRHAAPAPTASCSSSRRSATSSTARDAAPAGSPSRGGRAARCRWPAARCFADSGVAYTGDEFLGPRDARVLRRLPARQRPVGRPRRRPRATSRTRSSPPASPGDPFGVYAISGAAPGDEAARRRCRA